MRRSPVNELTAIGMVCVELSIRKAIGIIYSFHVQMKKNTSMTLSVGEFAYRREDGIYVIPIRTLGA